MSRQVLSMGFMALLKTPIGPYNGPNAAAHEELDERLQEQFGLSLNYEGTIVYEDSQSEEDSGISFFGDEAHTTFFDNLAEAGVEVRENSVQFYACSWYNGSDSNMAELTEEQFRKQTKYAEL